MYTKIFLKPVVVKVKQANFSKMFYLSFQFILTLLQGKEYFGYSYYKLCWSDTFNTSKILKNLIPRLTFFKWKRKTLEKTLLFTNYKLKHNYRFKD